MAISFKTTYKDFLKKNIEYIAGFILIAGAIVIYFTYPNQPKYTYSGNIDFVSTGNYKPPVGNNYFLLITLGSSSCLTCMLNVNDYVNLLQEKTNIAFEIVFLSKNKAENKRIAKIMNWQNCLIDTNLVTANRHSRLIMIDNEGNAVSISNISSGNITSQFYKKAVIKEHLSKRKR